MLVLKRNANEGWLACAVRYAKPYGLEAEVITHYNFCRAKGHTCSESAYFACEEWDLLDYKPGGEK